MRRCKGDEYKEMKELIYQIFLNQLDNINNIIDLIKSLDKKDKKFFLEELMKKCKFTYEEYYSNNQNTKILLLCELNEKGILKITDEDNYYGDIEKKLQKIKKDLDGDISIKTLEEFLDIEKKLVIKRLGLIKIILENFEPEKVYEDLKKRIKQISNDISELSLIKNSLLIFHRNKYQKEIKEISNIIKDMKDKNLKNYKNEKLQSSIRNLKSKQNIVDQVKKVKDFLLFKVLYDEAIGNDQEKRFDEAVKKLDDISKDLKKLDDKI
jgi:hypothetical protein